MKKDFQKNMALDVLDVEVSSKLEKEWFMFSTIGKLFQ
jgi:hypothetical protein